MSTIRDVARESGVSIATVSYVLNDGPRPVKEETRRHVQAVVERLGYHPNAMARALVRRRVDTLGVLFGCVERQVVTNAYAAGVLEGILAASSDAGYNVTLITQRWQNAVHSARPFQDGRCDGVLLIAPLQGSDMVQGLSRLKVPLVVISAETPEGSGVPFVDLDNRRGARLATEHLLALGHTRIAHLMGEQAQPSVPGRRKGFCEAMTRAGIEVPAPYVVATDYAAGSGHQAACALLSLPERPTAILAWNDALALAALEAARELRIAVPEELSLVGFDDIPSAKLVTPPLTTVRQPLAELGKRATRMLVAWIEGDEIAPASYRAEPQLVVRGSTAAPG